MSTGQKLDGELMKQGRDKGGNDWRYNYAQEQQCAAHGVGYCRLVSQDFSRAELQLVQMCRAASGRLSSVQAGN